MMMFVMVVVFTAVAVAIMPFVMSVVGALMAMTMVTLVAVVPFVLVIMTHKGFSLSVSCFAPARGMICFPDKARAERCQLGPHPG
ncbi:hypothetical protein EG829_32835 [bacterium]|nr:hypothetical protein [bacterium]